MCNSSASQRLVTVVFAFIGFIQTLQECRFGPFGPEDLGTGVPAVENMVDRPLLLETQFPWHDAASLRNRIAPVNYNLHDLTLSESSLSLRINCYLSRRIEPTSRIEPNNQIFASSRELRDNKTKLRGNKRPISVYQTPFEA